MVIYFLSSAHGRYIPKMFYEWAVAHPNRLNVDMWAYSALNDPDGEFYWEAWDRLCNEGRVSGTDGVKYCIFHDEDLFLVENSERGEKWMEERA